MNIRIRQLQEDLWLKESPLSYFPYNSFNSRKQKNNFIFANLLLCKHNDFNFIVNPENRNLKIGGLEACIGPYFTIRPGPHLKINLKCRPGPGPDLVF